MSIAVAVRHMLAAGMDHDLICAAIEEMEAVSAKSKSSGAARTAKWRANKAAESANCDVTSVTVTSQASQASQASHVTAEIPPSQGSLPPTPPISPSSPPPTPLKENPLKGVKESSPLPPEGELFGDGVTVEQSPPRKAKKPVEPWDGQWVQKDAKAPYRMPARIGDGPQEYKDFVKSGLPMGEIEEIAQKFRDHHGAKGSKFVDWCAAWRTWLRNEVEYRRQAEQRRPRPFDPGNYARH